VHASFGTRGIYSREMTVVNECAHAAAPAATIDANHRPSFEEPRFFSIRPRNPDCHERDRAKANGGDASKTWSACVKKTLSLT